MGVRSGISGLNYAPVGRSAEGGYGPPYQIRCENLSAFPTGAGSIVIMIRFFFSVGLIADLLGTLETYSVISTEDFWRPIKIWQAVWRPT